MSHDLYLPQGVRDLLEGIPLKGRHPGLQLDKFSLPTESKTQMALVSEVAQCTGDPETLRSVMARWRAMLKALNATCFDACALTPLTLHLSRATALENAGICLHPIHGFAYLPGSGLKGLARSWAETVWLAEQNDKVAAFERIEQVFGWAPGSRKGDWLPKEAKPQSRTAQAGAVVFHDALPLHWPTLEADIVNCHHGEYYRTPEAPPGDWEDPVPVGFLAVKVGAKFLFAVAPRRPGTDAGLVTSAAEWLKAALRHAGAGAKTVAGYGRFVPVEGSEPEPPKTVRVSAEFELELVTPAFLAGAQQKADDCTLRGATLRGLLRWWWRTLHAGHLPPSDLKRLEGMVWGTTEASAPLVLEVVPTSKLKPDAFNKESIKNLHNLRSSGNQRSKTTQGLFYAAYGMDETGHRRHYLPAGSRWRLRLSVRAKGGATAEQVLKQGLAALWLLSRYGGVGSKSRKGFGCFADVKVDDIPDLETCKTLARDFRQSCGFGEADQPTAYPNIDQAILAEFTLNEHKDVWRAIDELGYLFQRFAKNELKPADRVALGLPREVHDKQLHGGKPAGQPKPINRHAAPVHYHLVKDASGFRVRMTAFPSPLLPTFDKSREILKDLEDFLRRDLAQAPLPEIRVGTKGTWVSAGIEVTVISVGPDELTIEDSYGDTEPISRDDFTPNP